MFFGRNGKTPEKSPFLSTHSCPRYIKLGVVYRVISRKENGRVLVGDMIYLYKIIGTDEYYPRYVESPFILPEKFWVRKVIAHFTEYEILAQGEGELRQVLREKEPGFEPA